MSLADEYFKKQAKEILTNGFSDSGYAIRAKWADGTPATTKKIFGTTTRYNLAEEFPILTIRNAPFKYAVKETLWIFQQKSNNINDLNSKNWDSWADETGSIGKTYGFVAGEKYDYPEGLMDQVDNVLWCLKNRPMDRRMMVQLFRPEYIKQSGLPPCVMTYLFDVADNKLNMTVIQRSSDFLSAGGPGQSDEIGMAILQYMFAQASGYEVGELVHYCNNQHIYERHETIVETILKNPIYEAPKILVNPYITNFYDFTVNDFGLIDYKNTKLTDKFEVAI